MKKFVLAALLFSVMGSVGFAAIPPTPCTENGLADFQFSYIDSTYKRVKFNFATKYTCDDFRNAIVSGFRPLKTYGCRSKIKTPLVAQLVQYKVSRTDVVTLKVLEAFSRYDNYESNLPECLHHRKGLGK